MDRLIQGSFRSLTAAGLVWLAFAGQACGDDDDNAAPTLPKGGSSSKGGATGSGGAAVGGDSSTGSGGRSSTGGRQGNQAGEDAQGGNSTAPQGGSTAEGGAPTNTGGAEPVGGSGGEGNAPIACDDPVGPGGCYACQPDGSDDLQFLNRCTDSDCAAFDNSARIPGFTGTLPPL